jgi:hypothetical protein
VRLYQDINACSMVLVNRPPMSFCDWAEARQDLNRCRLVMDLREKVLSVCLERKDVCSSETFRLILIEHALEVGIVPSQFLEV